MSLLPGTRVGPYEIVAAVGAGGMGEVYKARDTRLKRDVAIKALPDTFATDSERLVRFQREAEILASLNHPHIAHIHGLEEAGPVRALVMEFVEGEDLAQRIARGPIPISDALPIARQIAEALEAAHEQGIIHRDLKPANIKVRADGAVKVLDFGIAKALDRGASASAAASTHSPTITSPAAMTQVGVVLGTVAYMPPEQARGLPVDKRADIWAFGCVLYEMLASVRPFAREGTNETLDAVVNSEVDWTKLPASLSPVIRTYLRRCLEKDPKQRVRDIGDMRLALAGAFDVTPELVDSTNIPQAAARTWRRALAWIGALAIVSAGTGAIVWRLATDLDERPTTFLLHPPEGSQFERRSMAPLPTLSRDGRHLAYVAPLESTPVVWVQRLGDLRAHALPGSEGADFPFWSPEADFIGFAVPGRLKKIAITGDRAPQDLCTCSAEYGGTWSPDGTVVFAGKSGLYRISSDGGEPIAVTEVDAKRQEFSHRFPLMLPDGRRFLYLIRSTQDEYRGIYLGSLDDPRLKRRVVPDDSNSAYGLSPDGRPYLFFVRDLTLLAQPFDSVRGEVSGDARVVARPVVPGEAGRLAPFAVAGRSLVYRVTSLSNSQLLWMDRRGVPQGNVTSSAADYSFPALSPDGKRLAVARRDSKTGLRDIWLIDLERAVSERLTQDPVSAGFPLWAPDGSKVIFASTRSGSWDVYSRAANGNGNDERIFDAPTSELPARYPRDITARFLLFGTGRALWVRPLDGQRQPYWLATASDGRISPDERWLAYTSPEGGERQIYLTTFPKPTTKSRVSTNGGEDPQWRRDGRELYYIAGQQTLMAVRVRPDGTFEDAQPLFRASFDSQSLAFGSAYSPAPDGQRFLVSERAADGNPLLAVTLNWTPNGR